MATRRRTDNSYTLNADNAVNDSYFRSCLRSTDAGYLPRPVAFQGSFSGAPSYAQRNQTLIADCLYKFPQPGVDSDRRVQYSNAKYPVRVADAPCVCARARVCVRALARTLPQRVVAADTFTCAARPLVGRAPRRARRAAAT